MKLRKALELTRDNTICINNNCYNLNEVEFTEEEKEIELSIGSSYCPDDFDADYGKYFKYVYGIVDKNNITIFI